MHGERKMKVRTTISIRKDLLEKARELGLNISRITEKALEEYIKAIDEPRLHTPQAQTPFHPSQTEDGGSGRGRQTSPDARWDSNPGPPAPQASVLSKLDHGPSGRMGDSSQI